jgi:hypothetical protein
MQKILLFALVGLALGAPTIHADGGVDCHSLSKWVSHASYNQGDLVWAENQDWHSDGAEYKCNPSAVHCSSYVAPKEDRDWKLVGNCKSGSKPN